MRYDTTVNARYRTKRSKDHRKQKRAQSETLTYHAEIRNDIFQFPQSVSVHNITRDPPDQLIWHFAVQHPLFDYIMSRENLETIESLREVLSYERIIYRGHPCKKRAHTLVQRF